MLELLTVVVLGMGLVPLGLFIFYYTTEAVPGRWWRRPSKLWASTALGQVFLAQTVNLFVLIGFILIVRATGGFPGREWVALSLYTILVGLFWAVLAVLRRIQKHPPNDE